MVFLLSYIVMLLTIRSHMKFTYIDISVHPNKCVYRATRKPSVELCTLWAVLGFAGWWKKNVTKCTTGA